MVELKNVDFDFDCGCTKTIPNYFLVNCISNVIRMNCVVHNCVVSTQVTMSIIYQ